jgi:hypothetical protein
MKPLLASPRSRLMGVCSVCVAAGLLLLGRPARAVEAADAGVPLLSAGYFSTPPALPGAVDPAVWQPAGATDSFNSFGTELRVPEGPLLQIGFDDRCLYLAVTVPLPPGVQPKTSARTRDGQVWADDALEIFIDPTHQHQSEYQFIVNAAGTQTDLRDQDISWNGAWEVASTIGPAAWTALVAIPWATLGLGVPTDRTVLGFNLAWDRQTPAAPPASWAPLSGSFHQPTKFGHVVLRRQGPTVTLRHQAESDAIVFAVTPGSGGSAALQATLQVRSGSAAVGTQSTAVAGATRLAVALPADGGRRLGGEYACGLVVQAAGDELPIARLAARVYVPPPLALALRQYPVAGRLAIDAEAVGLRDTAPQPTLEVRLCDDAGKEVLAPRREALVGGKVSFEFEVGALAAGRYRVQAVARAADAAALATGEAAFDKPETPSWLHSQAGISDQVLPPWTPLVVEGSRRKPVVRPWGRAYAFAGLPFPEMIRTRDAAVLAAPMQIRVRADGQPVTLRGTLRVEEETPAQVVLRGTAQGGPLVLTSTVTVDVDGNARVDLRLKATRPTRLEELVVEAPIKKAYATYRYAFPGTWGTAGNAGALPAAGWASAFVPFVWLGDEDRGLALYTESDEHWRPADPARAVEVVPAGETVVLRFNVVGQPLDLAATDDEPGLAYTFGFQATPVKQPDKDVWDYRICHYGGYGLENLTTVQPSTLVYPGKVLNPAAGTLEMWVRVRFDPTAPISDPATRGSLNRDLVTLSGGRDEVGLYWNIDDGGMRVYVKQDEAHPIVSGAPSAWREGERHHLALSWGEALRVYVDGKLTVQAPWHGSVSGSPAAMEVKFGGKAPGFEIDEIRLAGVQREPELSDRPYRPDEQTLLLDHLDQLGTGIRGRITVPERGDPGQISGRGELVAGQFGQALALASGPPILTLDYLKNLGVRTIVFHESWTEFENYPETIGHQEQLKSLVKACHERGLSLLLYFGYLLADNCPEWDAYHHEVLTLPMQGEYVREPAQKDYTVCYASAWQDFLADGIAKVLVKYDIDGVYLDGTEYPTACANRRHGCGYVRPDGTVAPTYPIFGAREMMRRIYTLVKTAKPDGQVNCHNSTCMTIPTLGWATSSWDGEQFGSIPRGTDVGTLLPLDTFRCEFMGRQWGVPSEFLCYERPYTTHEALSFTLLHDVLVRGSGPGLEEAASLWQAMADFGRPQATFLPYWNNRDVATVSPAGCHASLYSRPGHGVLCVLSNLGGAAAEATLQLDLRKLKLSANVQAVDALTGQPIASNGGALSVRLDALDYRVLRLSEPPAAR